jgi:hypothetical protein
MRWLLGEKLFRIKDTPLFVSDVFVFLTKN